MIRRLVAPMLLLVVCSAGVAAPAAGGTAPMQVEIDRTSAQLRIGQGFDFATTVTNDGDVALTDLVAHLNIASADGSTYVDPEDWSSRRSQYLASLAPGQSQRLSWNVHAVNGGDLIIYVAVTTRSGPDVVAASEPLRARVTAIRTIDAAGVLPVAIAVPTVLLVCLGLARRHRRRRA